MMTTANPSKRQRTTSPPRGLHIDDIPAEALTVVAKFLPKPSQALFAASMTAPSSSWRRESESEKKRPPSAACQAILSLNPHKWSKRRDENWAVLDFVDIERSLARRLSDEDVHAVLVCIDAATKLEILKLTGCVNITGRGLMPLRGSPVLKQIDLSLVCKHENPYITPAPSIEESVVFPLLDSIVDAEGGSLKQLQLPKKFRVCRDGSPPSELVEEFVFKYDAFMEKLGGTCAKCNCEEAYWGNENINGNPWFIDDEESQFYGCQNFTCYECLGHFCLGGCVGHCMECEKSFCADCAPILACDACRQEKCAECWERNNCDCVEAH